MLDSRRVAIAELGEGELALRGIDLFPLFFQPGEGALRGCAIRGAQRAPDFLAAAFESGIVNAVR